MLGGTSATTKERTNLGFKESNQHWVHVLELVRDIQANYALVLELGAEVLSKSVPMGALHDKDDVGPLNQL